jgi:hypothetical protein
LFKKHISGAEIIFPVVKNIIKEEKDQNLKKQNYYRKEVLLVDFIIIIIYQELYN